MLFLFSPLQILAALSTGVQKKHLDSLSDAEVCTEQVYATGIMSLDMATSVISVIMYLFPHLLSTLLLSAMPARGIQHYNVCRVRSSFICLLNA